MSFQYFYSPDPWEIAPLVLNREESFHCARVCRCREGDTIGLTSGDGRLAQATIIAISREPVVILKIQENTIRHYPPPKPLRLFISPLQAPDRMEWLVEKATELGATEITWILCHRTVRNTVRMERLQRVALAALKQSARPYLPRIVPPQPFTQLHEPAGSSWIATCHDQLIPPRLSLSQLAVTPPTNIFIGPEGDFTEEEVQLALQKGAIPVSLGPYRLRSETAALKALSLISSILEKEPNLG
ncbi:MAG: 16S rRNA (uracil(1498)-N(3))-methyltransferase [Flavobacteriales bacterium]|nr:16S rRNA (uracil(1498)-N(3))-methyltransferase [Flavobacteriales bacterium]MDW8410976.1 RsmE family RNA methyltransferase [Flavobacteriales bacterium]